jgi:hypothetical protein
MNDLMKLPLSVVIRPGETFRCIPLYRHNFSYLPVFVLFFLTICARVGFIFITHFPLAALDPRDANIFLEMVKLLVPLVTWAVASYAVTSIMDGEAEFREILLASAFAMVPYILLAVPIAGFSQVLSSVGVEKKIFSFLNTVVWIWVLFLLFLSVKNLHDYHVGKTVLVCVISVLGMALIWSLFVLMFALTGNLRAFVQGLALEAWMTVKYR